MQKPRARGIGIDEEERRRFCDAGNPQNISAAESRGALDRNIRGLKARVLSEDVGDIVQRFQNRIGMAAADRAIERGRREQDRHEDDLNAAEQTRSSRAGGNVMNKKRKTIARRREAFRR